MKYQLIEYAGMDYTILDESDDLPNDSARNGWYAQATYEKTPSEGKQFGIIDEQHGWFKKPKAEPVAVTGPTAQKPASAAAAEVANTEPLAGAGTSPAPVESGPTNPPANDTPVPLHKGQSPSFNEVMQYQKQVWDEERKQEIAEREEIGAYLAKFKRA